MRRFAILCCTLWLGTGCSSDAAGGGEVCGNGAREGRETCDDGNGSNDDDCPDGPGGTCRANTCGDGFVNINGPVGLEECDDGAGNDDLGDCNLSCAFTRCGDGIVQMNSTRAEACDDGNGTLDDDCPDGPAGSCQDATCTDGFRNVLGPSFPNTMGNPEQCDDGDMIDTNACSNNCTLPMTCGNGMAEMGEPCDTALATASDTLPGSCTDPINPVCRTDCTCPRCGDGVPDVPLGEECDDRNTAPGDGCDANCKLEVTAACGNGVLEAGNNEQCDDNNTSPGDGCSPTCQFEPVGPGCGNSADPAWDMDVGMDEDCDEGPQVCADGVTACTSNMQCMGQTPGTCLPANGDNCNTTCSSGNRAETFFLSGDGEVTLAVDNTYLWYTAGPELYRMNVQDCINHNNSLVGTGMECTDATGGPAACPSPCVVELVAAPPVQVTGLMPPQQVNLSTITTDGRTVWFGASEGIPCGAGMPQPKSLLYALSISACNTALQGGAANCNAQAQIVAGDDTGYLDGNGTAARIQGMRGLTYYNGFVYMLDGGCGTLRRFDPLSGDLLTIVGDPACQQMVGFQEGFGSVLPNAGGASLNSPRYMTTDLSGFLYISDNADHTISRYNVFNNYLEYFVGDPVAGYGHADAYDGTQAQFARPRDLTSDGTSLFIADFDNYVIRQVDIATTRTTTMVGTVKTGAPQGSGQACVMQFGRGTSANFHKPLQMAYHYPSGSLFFNAGGTRSMNLCFAPPCGIEANTNIRNAVWRIW